MVVAQDQELDFYDNVMLLECEAQLSFIMNVLAVAVGGECSILSYGMTYNYLDMQINVTQMWRPHISTSSEADWNWPFQQFMAPVSFETGAATAAAAGEARSHRSGPGSRSLGLAQQLVEEVDAAVLTLFGKFFCV